MFKYAFYNVQPVKVDYEFKTLHSFDKRKKQSALIRTKYMDIIPIIVEKAGTRDVPDISSTKILVDKNITVDKFLFQIRKQLQINHTQAMFLFINNKVIPSNSDRMETLYQEHMDSDGFLYITYCLENVFG
jgi:GABA(A) receptor-associated protein